MAHETLLSILVIDKYLSILLKQLIVIYNRIDESVLEKIVEIQLKELSERLKNSGLEVKYSSELKKHLCQTGFDSEYGARPLKRLIQRELGNSLSEFILKGNYQQGTKLIADYKMGAIELSFDSN